MKKKILLSTLLSCQTLSVMAQTVANRIHIGVRGGINISQTDYSLLKNHSPKFVTNSSGGIFTDFEFRKNKPFSTRPEVDFLSRGTKINDNDLDYKLNTKYTDFQLPLIFNFGNPEKIRPYIYVASIVGFVRGGKTSLKNATEYYKIDTSSTNMADTYFVGGGGMGFKLPFHFTEISKYTLL